MDQRPKCKNGYYKTPGEKTVSSISGAGKTGQLYVKEIKTFPDTIYKSKLKMD